MENQQKAVLATVMSILTYMFGGWDAAFKALLVVAIIDHLTGMMCAYQQGDLCSKKGAQGIAKKVMFFAVVALACIIDQTFELSQILRNATIYFFLANEGISILENAGKMGIPIPEELTKRLRSLKEKSETESEKVK